MGFLSSILKPVKKVVGAVTGALGVGTGDLLGIGSSLFGGMQANSAAAANVAQANEFTKEMMQNRHQWEVQDLIKAGLNPILSAGGTPSMGGSPVAPVVNTGENVGNSARASAMNIAQREAIRATIDKTKADTASSQTQAALNMAATKKMNADAVLSSNSAMNAATNNILLQQAIPKAKLDADFNKGTFAKVMRYIDSFTKSVSPFVNSASSATQAIKK